MAPHLLLLLLAVAAPGARAAVLPCTSPDGCPEHWSEERTRDHLERCWKQEWCQKLMRQALEELRIERLADAVEPIVKKDVFSSRGWAAGGLPSHFTFINNRKVLQQQREFLKHEGQQEAGGGGGGVGVGGKARQPRFSPLLGGGPGMALVADSRIFEEDVDENTQPPEPPQAQVGHLKVENAQYHHRNYSSLPQLFVSYGWGPLGK